MCIHVCIYIYIYIYIKIAEYPSLRTRLGQAQKCDNDKYYTYICIYTYHTHIYIYTSNFQKSALVFAPLGAPWGHSKPSARLGFALQSRTS